QTLLLLESDRVVGLVAAAGTTVLTRRVGALLEVLDGLGRQGQAERPGQTHLAAGAIRRCGHAEFFSSCRGTATSRSRRRGRARGQLHGHESRSAKTPGCRSRPDAGLTNHDSLAHAQRRPFPMPRLLLRREPPPDRRELELVRRLLRLIELRLLPELELD